MEHKKFKAGCHSKAGRLLYEHYDIYIGGGLVIHYVLNDITVDTAERFARGEIMKEVPHFGLPYTGEEIRKKALSRLEEDRYDLVSNSCERFANWRCTGEAESKQVEGAVRLAGTLLLKMLEGC